ncbi:MAG: GGDEF domain-containing protein [Blautia sp.]|nr:GGDEF domain-containing protein [Blautia sp.]
MASEENRILNKYLLIGWSVIAGILVMTYAVEVMKGAFSLGYYAGFLAFTLIPLAFCIIKRRKEPKSYELRYQIIIGYFLMYGFVLLTGHTSLVFTYIFPLLSIVILYHDSDLVLKMGVAALIFNIASIIRDYHQGKITLIDTRDYEIQIALIVLCFGGCYMATYIYGRISDINQEREQEVLRLLEERIIMEERNKYAFIDAMTDLGNRRKFDEDVSVYRDGVPDGLHVVMVDINNLKSANDSWGHVAGDELIVGVSNCIRTAFDGEECRCYRLGGDEFMMLCISSDEVFQKKLNRLRNYISLWKGIHVKEASIAAGTASAKDGKDFDMLCRLADERMYIEKKNHYSRATYDTGKKLKKA